MESYEATTAVFTKVQNIDPENASKIMGYVLLNFGEKDMIRLAHGPETIIVSIVNKAKNELGLSSNTLSAPLVTHITNPISISRPTPLSLSLPSPRGFNQSSPSSPSIWSVSPNSANHSVSSYASVVNGSCNNSIGCFGSPQLPFSTNNSVDDSHLHDQNHPFINSPLAVPSKNANFFDQTMDLAALSPGCRSDSMVYPFLENSNGTENQPQFHRRSYSFNDGFFGTDDSTSGFGYKPCLYFSRGFCKNGGSCKFVHGGGGGFLDALDNNSAPIVGSPKYDVFEQCQEELLRSKIANQQRLAAHLLANGLNLPYNKLNFLHGGAHRSALMMGEELHKLNRARIARHEFLRGDSNSRQIYLTFPADSTFREEDVSEYFSRFGPVQDVRIPYQQKRMFGFVTFVYPETVNMILAKGNPHFVCDSRVLVKPYKEKGKLPDKKQQQMERGDFSCSSPSGLDCREPFDFPLEGRMLYSPEEMLLKRRLDEQALELQGRRLLNLQILDMKNHLQHDNVPIGSPILSPNLSQAFSNQNGPPPSDGLSQNASEEENKGTPTEIYDQQLDEAVNTSQCDSNGNGNVINNSDNPENVECELSERPSSGHGALGM